MMKDKAPLIIGVDGGGTGCRIAIQSASGAHMADAVGGAANYTTDPDGAVANVLAALRVALSDAGLDTPHLAGSFAHVGLAGVLGQAKADALTSALPFAHLSVSDDRITSVQGALGPEDGVLVAIGTGSFVASRHAGAHRFFGGWGLQVGDQASGAWLGRAALERCLLAADGLMTDSELTRTVLEQFAGGPEEIVAFARQAQPKDYATLAPIVVDAARAGDPIGRALMQAGAGYVMDCIRTDGPGSQDLICLSGGVGPHYAPYLDQVFQDRLQPARGSALDGALQFARAHHDKAHHDKKEQTQ